jgi:hypothetical protein
VCPYNAQASDGLPAERQRELRYPARRRAAKP